MLVQAVLQGGGEVASGLTDRVGLGGRAGRGEGLGRGCAPGGGAGQVFGEGGQVGDGRGPPEVAGVVGAVVDGDLPVGGGVPDGATDRAGQGRCVGRVGEDRRGRLAGVPGVAAQVLQAR